MATFTNAASFAQHINKIPKKLAAAEREVVGDASLLVKRTILARAAMATGGDLRLSGSKPFAGRKRRMIGPVKPSLTDTAGKALGVRYKIRNKPSGASSLISGSGSWPLVENDVKPHPVTSRYAVAKFIGPKVGRHRGLNPNTIQARGENVLGGVGVGGGRRAVLHWGNTYRRFTFASSKGRQPWAKAVDDSRPAVRQIMISGQRKALVKAVR